MIKKRPSKTARDLTRHLLAPCPKDRLSSAAALKHEWFLVPAAALFDSDKENLPLLDTKDFEEGFAKIERDLGWVFGAFANVGLASREQAQLGASRAAAIPQAKIEKQLLPQPAKADTTQLRRGVISLDAPLTVEEKRRRALYPQGALPLQRGLSDVTNLLPPHALGGSGSALQRRHSIDVAPQTVNDPNYLHRRGSTCCLCNSTASMLDHVCPCCRAVVCTSCICDRLPKQDLRCPSCNDSHSNEQNMRLILNVHETTASIGNLWSSITESFGSQSFSKTRSHSALMASPRAPMPLTVR